MSALHRRDARWHNGPSTPAATPSARRMTILIALAVVITALSALAAAPNITGTVTNGTTGKPAAGDEVTLLSLSQGMQEVGSTKTDAQGRFSMAAPADPGVPHMVRVTHGGVNYFPQGGPLMPGATNTDIWEQFWPDAPRQKMVEPASVAEAVLYAVLLPPAANLSELVLVPMEGVL